MDATRFTTLNGLIGSLVILAAWGFFFFSRIKSSKLWTITVTPLAAIIGSGFLIAAPLAYTDFGAWAIPFILLLNLFAMGVGEAIRTNIRDFDPRQEEYAQGDKKWIVIVERGSNWLLGICYIVAIAFYISLLSYFVFDIFGIKGDHKIIDGITARMVMNGMTTVILASIGIYGYFKGLHALEKVEKIAVNLKMGVIIGLVVVLAIYAVGAFTGVVDTSYPFTFIELDMHKIQILAGLLLITQGFETVKFMADDYSIRDRNKAMIIAQVIAALVYVVFVPLAGPLSAGLEQITETAIADVISEVALGMGIVLSLAAIFSQSGAAIADTIAGGGLVEEESKRVLNERQAYLPVIAAAILLVWMFPVFEIITLASRFFALYYLAQTIIAVVVSYDNKRHVRTAFFSGVALVLGFIVVFAIPAA